MAAKYVDARSTRGEPMLTLTRTSPAEWQELWNSVSDRMGASTRTAAGAAGRTLRWAAGRAVPELSIVMDDDEILRVVRTDVQAREGSARILEVDLGTAATEAATEWDGRSDGLTLALVLGVPTALILTLFVTLWVMF